MWKHIPRGERLIATIYGDKRYRPAMRYEGRLYVLPGPPCVSPLRALELAEQWHKKLMAASDPMRTLSKWSVLSQGSSPVRSADRLATRVVGRR